MFGLEKFLGKGFGSDMATDMIAELMKRLREEKGTRSICISVNDNDEITIVELQFDVLEKLRAVNGKINDLTKRLKEFKIVKDNVDVKEIENDKENG